MSSTLVLASICLVIAGGLTPTREAEAVEPEQWDRRAFERLFPEPAAGWSLSEMQVDQETAFMGDLGAMLGGAERVRYGLFRSYRGDEGTIDVTVLSEDIEFARVIIVAHGLKVKGGDLVPMGTEAAAELQKIRDQLLSGGMRPIERAAHLGVERSAGGRSSLALLLGDSGIVLLECGYADCVRDVTALVRRLDLPRLDEFSRFDHRNTE